MFIIDVSNPSGKLHKEVSVSNSKKTRIFLLTLSLLLILSTASSNSLAESGTSKTTLKLGYRIDSPPFSYVKNNSPVGYSVNLCEKIGLAAIKNELYTNYKFIEVTVQDRFEKLNTEEIDVLCEATTVTLARIQKFDSTFYTFLSGASFMYPANLTVNSEQDFSKKRIGVLKGTTTQNAMYDIIFKKTNVQEDGIKAQDLLLKPVETHHKSIELFKKNEIDIYFADRDILLALRSLAANEGLRLQVSKKYFTNEPYALFMRKNTDDLLYTANKTLVELFRSGDIRLIFAQHFPGFIMSRSLRDIFFFQSILDGKDPLEKNSTSK
jgi:polar amino acid transport system substrate-binding protein/glutamate/aspartate transport system substrate-binding protein